MNYSKVGFLIICIEKYSSPLKLAFLQQEEEYWERRPPVDKSDVSHITGNWNLEGFVLLNFYKERRVLPKKTNFRILEGAL